MKDISSIKTIIMFMIVCVVSCENEVNNPQNNSENNGLSAPQRITAQTLSSTSVRIAWTTVSGAYQYLIYRSVTSNGLPAPVDYTFDNYFIDSDLIPGEKYFYRVAAIDLDYNAGASSKYAEAMTDMPQAPTKPSSQEISSTQIKVSWTTVPGAVKYQVFRSITAEGNYGNIPLAETEENTYLDSGLQPDSTYYYKITAVTKNGTTSPMSNYTYGTTRAAESTELLPSAPLNLNAAAQSSGSVFITWSPVAGAISYRVYRGSALRGSTTGTSFTDTGLSAGTSYTYSVSAVNGSGEGAKSASGSVRTYYVVTFDSAGGTDVPSQDVASGGRATKPANPTRVGFDFVEWRRNGAVYNFSSTVAATLTLTAIWTPKTIAAPSISGIVMTSDVNGYRIQWNAVSGAEYYKIYKSNSKSGIFNYLGSVTGTSFEDKGASIVQVGASSFYQITAFKRDQGIVDIESAKSTARGVTTTNPRILVTSSFGFYAYWKEGMYSRSGCSEVRVVIGDVALVFSAPSINSSYREISPGTYNSVYAYGVYNPFNSPGYHFSDRITYGTQNFNVNTTYTFSGFPVSINSKSHLTIQ
ncbi:MAG: fibronectin type III domain-containing protein [Treponema sp.]|jgi:fibronectin type 3 domain-containing protein|nr:fibronectin type III domain-containing protein [Treponema sp.]